MRLQTDVLLHTANEKCGRGPDSILRMREVWVSPGPDASPIGTSTPSILE